MDSRKMITEYRLTYWSQFIRDCKDSGLTILEATSRRLISLAEAGVGTGKTFAYLIPAIIAKRARLGSIP